MILKPGTLLISAPSIKDAHFDKVVVFIAEYNFTGAMGFIINKLFPRKFNELVEFNHSKPFSLYEGGPVENDKLFFLHQRPDLIEEGTSIINAINLGGDFKQTIVKIDEGILNETDIKLFIGYCGWDPGQLEEEILEGSWLICSTNTEAVFLSKIEMLWEEIYKISC